MKKRRVKIIVSIVIIISILLMFMTIYTNAITNGIWIGDYKYIIYPKERSVSIVEYKGDDENVIVPYDCLFGYKNLSVPAVFTNSKKIKSVVISDGITSIEKSAFDQCTNLKEVNIPNSVEYIGQYAFSGTQFEKDHYSNKYYVAGDGVLVFYNANESEAIIPKGVKTLTHDTYYQPNKKGYVEAKQIYIPETIEDAEIYVKKDVIIYFGEEEINFGDENGERWNAECISGTVVAPEGSYMETFCKKYGVKFRVMTEEEETIWREKTEAAASEITYQK